MIRSIRGSTARGNATPEELERLTALLTSDEFKNLKESYMNFNVADAITLTVKGPGGNSIISNGAHPEAFSKVIVECQRLMLSIK